MHRGLPLVVSIGVVSFNSTKLEFGTLVNSAMLVGLHAVHFWDSKFTFRYLLSSVKLLDEFIVPSTSDIISICNAVVGFSEVLKYSFPSLKSCNLAKQTF